MLITAGPTHEPIDAVRFIGNRSSGRLGIALAREAARRGWETELLLGPSTVYFEDENILIRRFRTTDELQQLLEVSAPVSRVVVMAAAVADFRPKRGGFDGKLSRRAGLTLELEPTPDLLAGLAAKRATNQVLVGFALEPRAGLIAAAREKLDRKGVDMIVANPLETMDSPTIEAVVLSRLGTENRTPDESGQKVEIGGQGPIPKERFASWLLDRIEAYIAATEQGS
jgi:phosphopantothenoylcysteine decarboxylase / phosphopantothenate---cysteine ligase